MKCLLFLLCFTGGSLSASAQDTITIRLPDMQIFANKLMRGNADLYGLGDWICRYRISLKDSILVMKGDIIFRENANDYTIMEGAVKQSIVVPELTGFAGCQILLSPSKGEVRGLNIGARGYQWFRGHGLVRRAFIRTDTLGLDVGKVGGRVQFQPVKIIAQCYFMAGR